MDHLSERPGLTTPARVTAFDRGNSREFTDDLATEEPLEIRLLAGGELKNAALTMRTPGADFELAAGFLFAEGVIAGRDGISGITYCVDSEIDADQRYNIVNVRLRAQQMPDLQRLERYFSAGSACGVCGKATIDALAVRARILDDPLRVSAQLIAGLPGKMRETQRVFSATGGLHAAALFSGNGDLLVLREDVGRHNALDKVVGWALMNGRIPLAGCIAMVSGRASYELVQKSIVAGIPLLCAVSAPSSLAVSLAREFNLTLAGFVREGRANIYSAPERVVAAD